MTRTVWKPKRVAEAQKAQAFPPDLVYRSDDPMAPSTLVTAVAGPAYQVAHPDALEFAAWYLGTVRCRREHVQDRQVARINAFPCLACSRWATEIVTSALFLIPASMTPKPRKPLAHASQKGARKRS